jgi:hypothetical protein
MNYPIIFETTRPTTFVPVSFALPGILLVITIGALVMKRYKTGIVFFVVAAGMGFLAYMDVEKGKNLKPIALFQDCIEINSEKIPYNQISSHVIMVVTKNNTYLPYQQSFRTTSVDVSIESEGQPKQSGEKTLIITRNEGEAIKISESDYDVSKIDEELTKLIK